MNYEFSFTLVTLFESTIFVSPATAEIKITIGIGMNGMFFNSAIVNLNVELLGNEGFY